VTSRTTGRFWDAYAALPAEVRRHARAAYRLFSANPEHPSLRFKKVHPSRPIYSVRITRDHRAVGLRDGADMLWFWIGSHEEYERLLSRL
jgi:hypothetical protein